MEGNVFISWSGERSKRVGNLLKSWLPTVLQRCTPWISTDADRGAIWFSEISGQLSDTNVGIICLTKENMNAPWILFEAGALAKGLSQSRVCPLLIDLESRNISAPLSQFNCAKVTKSSILALLETLNRTLPGPPLQEDTLHRVFDRMWPDFDAAFNEIINDTTSVSSSKRSPTSMIPDIYDTVQRIEKLLASSRTIENYPPRMESFRLHNDSPPYFYTMYSYPSDSLEQRFRIRKMPEKPTPLPLKKTNTSDDTEKSDEPDSSGDSMKPEPKKS